MITMRSLLTSGAALGVDPTRLRVITTRRRDAAGNVSTVVVMPANPLNGYRFSCVLAPSATTASVVAAVSAHGLSTAQLAVSGGHVDLNVTAASSAFAEDLEYAFCLHNESTVCKLLCCLSCRCDAHAHGPPSSHRADVTGAQPSAEEIADALHGLWAAAPSTLALTAGGAVAVPTSLAWTVTPATADASSRSAGAGTNIYIIAAAAGGGALLVVVAVLLIRRRRAAQKSSSEVWVAVL